MEWQVESLWTLLAILQQSLKHETQSVARSLAVMGDNAGCLSLCGEQRRSAVKQQLDPSEALLPYGNVTASEPARVICTLAAECRSFCVRGECLFVLRGRYML